MKRATFLAGICMLSAVSVMSADPPAADWNALLPSVQRAVRHAFPKEAANAHYLPSIVLTADLSGMGGSEALVSLGSGGYTDDVTVVQLQGATPVPAKFRGRDDRIGPMVFTSGTTEDRGGEVRLVAKDHAVFAGYWELKGAKMKECRGEVYQWDAVAKDFSYEKKMSKQMGREYCQAVVAKLRK